MYKIIIILISALLISGCSVLRKERIEVFDNTYDDSDKGISDNLKNGNLSNHNYYIQKAEVQVFGQNELEKLLLSIKFNRPDKYLISIRSKTGIEAARLFISADTILLNDRIHRKLYCSSPAYLKKKYGFTLSHLPVLIGDYIDNSGSVFRKENCIDDKVRISGSVNEVKFGYLIDCKLEKSVLTVLESSLSSERIEIKNSDFFEEEKVIIPGDIEINDSKRESIINIKIRKITFLWDGYIDFIPGKKYEIIELL